MRTKLTAPAIRARKVRDGGEPARDGHRLRRARRADGRRGRRRPDPGRRLRRHGRARLRRHPAGHRRRPRPPHRARWPAAWRRRLPTGEAKKPFVVADLPWMSYHTTPVDTVQNAAQLIRAGAQGVKLEGGRKRLPMIEAILDAEIPVMGHLGLTPQSRARHGRLQGAGPRARRRARAGRRRQGPRRRRLLRHRARGRARRGGPHGHRRRRRPHHRASAPAPACDGQVLVYHDVLGIEDRILPKFVRRYADLKAAGVEALSAFAADVRSGAFPGRGRELPPERRGRRDARPLRPAPPSASEPPRIHRAACRGDPRRAPPASCCSSSRCVLVGVGRVGVRAARRRRSRPTRRSASRSTAAHHRRRCRATPTGCCSTASTRSPSRSTPATAAPAGLVPARRAQRRAARPRA